MYRAAAVLLLALAACRSLNENDPTTRSAPHVRTIHETRGSGSMNTTLFVELANDYHAPVTRVDAPPEKVWPAVTAIYGELGLPVTRIDTQGRHVASEGFNIQRRFLDQNMSKWFDCGRGAAGIVRADRYRIQGTLQSIVGVGDDGKTQLLTSLRARGHDESGDSSNPVPCSSTGELERYIANAVILRVVQN